MSGTTKNLQGFYTVLAVYCILLVLCQNHAIAIKNSKEHDLIGSKTRIDIDWPLPSAVELSFKFDENLPLAKIFDNLFSSLNFKVSTFGG